MKQWIMRIFGEAFSLSSDTAPQDEIYDRLVGGAAIKGTNMCILIVSLMGRIPAVSYGFASGTCSCRGSSSWAS